MLNTTVPFIISGIVTSYGFYLYIRNLRRYSDMHVSAISWLVWLFAEFENLYACFYNFQLHDWPRMTFCVITTAATVAILITAVRRKMHDKPTGEDYVLAGILCVGLYAVVHDMDNTYSTTFALLAIALGYMLTILGVLKGDLHERAKPWLVVCIGALITYGTYIYAGIHGIVKHFAMISVLGEGGVFCAVIIRSKLLKRK